MSEGSEKIRARARLALRAEKAFGLDALPIRIDHHPAQNESTLIPREAQARVELPQVPATPVSAATARKSVVDLFGVASAAEQSSPEAVFTSPAHSTEEKRRLLAEIDAQVKACKACILHERRKNTVLGEGDPEARIMFIGEGPGENEDLQGRPFVGRAGDLLNNMITGMGLKREQVYIANIVKCRPPNNREPAPDEVATCTPFLERQIEIIRPRVIVTLGRPALQHMLQQKISISKMRGQWLSWRGIRLMPTFHPAYLLRNYTKETRAAVWSDLKQVMSELGMQIPPRGNREE
jgi:uracil-DNA glycosylase